MRAKGRAAAFALILADLAFAAAGSIEFTGGKGDKASLGKWLEHRFKVSAKISAKISARRFVDAEQVKKIVGAPNATSGRRERNPVALRAAARAGPRTGLEPTT